MTTAQFWFFIFMIFAFGFIVERRLDTIIEILSTMNSRQKYGEDPPSE